MTRKFLEDMGLEKEVIDKILDENSADIGKEIAKTTAAKTDLAATKAALDTVQGELDTLKQSSGDTEAVQKELDEWKQKYATDTEALQTQINDRDYADAISKAISGANDGKGLKFSSKGAQTAFISALKEKGLELKDGDLDGFEDFVKAQKETDPDAFLSDKPAPKFVSRVGVGGPPAVGQSKAREIADKYHANLYGTVKENE